MLAPFLSWRHRVGRKSLRADMEAAVIGAIVVLPQGLAFAALAGMPPIHGVYVSILPVIVAALWGSSWHTVSGPNAGIAVIVGATLAPLAAVGSDNYIGLAFMLAVMVGTAQFAIGMFRLGSVLDFISSTVIAAVVMAIGVVLVLAAARALTGLSAPGGQSILLQLVDLVRRLSESNPYSTVVGLAAIVAGFGARRYLPRYALLVAVGAGWLVSLFLEFVVAPDGFSVARIGAFDMQVVDFVIPWLAVDGPIPFLAMAPGTVSIVLLGMAQTVVMSRSTGKKSGQLIDANQEIVGQGLSNITAAFVSAFAGSGSFNRTAVNYQAGARTPLAAVFASLILLAMLLLAADVVAVIPAAAIGGTLLIVGYGLMDFKTPRACLASPAETVAWLATFGIAIGIGLNEAIGAGILVSLVNYLWHASKPNIRIEEHYARDGRRVTSVTLDGNLFFGSVQYFERALSGIDEGREPGIFLLRTDHMTYLDVPGARALEEQAQRHRDGGDAVYVYLTRPWVEEALKRAGARALLSGDSVIRRDHDHPMKEVLYPHRPAAGHPARNATAPGERRDIGQIAAESRKIKLLSPMSEKALEKLFDDSGIQQAAAGEPLMGRSESAHKHVLLIDGKVEARRNWTTGDGVQKSSTRVIGPDQDNPDMVLLAASPRGMELRAMSDVAFIAVEADAIDRLLGRRLATVAEEEAGASVNAAEGLSRTGIMQHLPPEGLHRVLERMTLVEIEAGHPVVVQDEPGEDYFLIEEGHAEVWREDPLSGESERLAQLGPGDSFGEEALLQGGYRNATVRMTTPGRLLRLSKGDFDALVKEPLAREVESEEAKDLLDTGVAALIDCRYDMEYRESRIPGAVSLPLDELRARSHGVDLDRRYIVYCRNGERSKVAAFLLKERGIDAVSLQGGIAGWQYELDLAESAD